MKMKRQLRVTRLDGNVRVGVLKLLNFRFSPDAGVLKKKRINSETIKFDNTEMRTERKQR